MKPVVLAVDDTPANLDVLNEMFVTVITITPGCQSLLVGPLRTMRASYNSSGRFSRSTSLTDAYNVNVRGMTIEDPCE